MGSDQRRNALPYAVLTVVAVVGVGTLVGMWVAAQAGESEPDPDPREETAWTIYWETYDEPGDNKPLSFDPHPSALTKGTGNIGPMRIFPGKTTHDDADADKRRLVFAVVKWSEEPTTDSMWFRLWDVDDPSASGPPIDTKPTSNPGSSGPDNSDENEWAMAGEHRPERMVLVPLGTVKRFSGESDCDSKTCKVAVRVSMQPGDNWRFCACTYENGTSLLHMTQDQADRVDPPGGVKESKSLTTWRTLHLEEDSMSQVTGNTLGGAVQAVEIDGGMAWLTIENLPGVEGVWEEDDHFVPGRIRVAGYNNNNWYDVTDFDSIVGNDKVQVTNSPTLEGCEGAAYWLQDDDYLQVNGFPPMALPRLLGRESPMDEAFRNAYVDVMIEEAAYDPDTPFILNTTTDWSDDSYWKNAATANKDLSSSAPFWHVHVTAAFQHDKPGDGDPDEGIVAGGMCGILSGALIFIEGERELFTGGIAGAELFVGYNISHEVGHLFGLEHSDGSPGTIMAPFSGQTTELRFSETSIMKIREKDWPMH